MFDTCSGAGGGSREVSMASCMRPASTLHPPIHARRRMITNVFAHYICNQFLRRLRPGIAAAEQTLGPARKRHGGPFNGPNGDFAQGYTMRWQVVRLYTWALSKTEGGIS
ncbi:DNA (cytosine-5-)-methyltransferase [Fusarium coicis]|nr:DNA (cytosine-5-)-methyltransferase [Fusarium coicis]